MRSNLDIVKYAKMINYNLRCERTFLRLKNITPLNKLSFIFKKYYSIVFRLDNIKYLNNLFFYDNRFVPALLQLYPEEINEIDRAIKLKNIHTVLDIGANIGQWAYTLKNFFPQVRVYSFEPNKDIFDILKKNSSYFSKWDIHNYALGDRDSKRILYYSTEASAEGGFFKENLYQNYIRKNIREIPVNMIRLNENRLKELNIYQKIDLVKIDVEGFETEVLRSLKDIDFKYLYIEISLRRKGNSTIDDIRKIIKEVYKKEAELIYYNIPDRKSLNANVIFSLSKVK